MNVKRGMFVMGVTLGLVLGGRVALGQDPIDSVIDEITKPGAAAAATTNGKKEPAAAPAAPAAPAAVEAAAAPATGARDEVANDAPLTPENAKLMAVQEEIRRQAREVEAKKGLENATQMLKEGKLDEAIKGFQRALTDIPKKTSNEAVLAETAAQLKEARLAKVNKLISEKGDMAVAQALLGELRQQDPALKDLDKLAKKVEKVIEEKAADQARPKPVTDEPAYVAKTADISKLMARGKEYFQAGEYVKAEEAFEQVLLRDEYNTDAMRFLRKLDDERYESSRRAREMTQADMINQVKKSWTPAITAEVKRPEEGVKITDAMASPATANLMRKLTNIVIQKIEFREATIKEVIDFLSDSSEKNDPEGVGVNILLKLEAGAFGAAAAAAPAAAPAAADIFDIAPAAPAGAPAPAASGAGVDKISMNLRRVNLLSAIKYVTEVARLQYRLDENAVIITRAGVVIGNTVTRLYPVPPSVIETAITRVPDTGGGQERTGSGGGEFIEMGARETTLTRGDVKDFFKKLGINFPEGTDMQYLPSISRLVVTHTPENHDKIAEIIANINIQAQQVEIEARFVEIAQDDLEEIGFEWLLTDNWELAQKDSAYGMPSGERVQVNANGERGGFTRGLRFFDLDQQTGTIKGGSKALNPLSYNPLGDLFTIAGILTNPELSVVLHALKEKGGTDLLSAPRVTTKNQFNATIQVVKEIIYPTEFETEVGDTVIGVDGQGRPITGRAVVTTPGSFETRETGVILNVTPTVGPDGYTIDLTLAPEVAELVDWIQYGTPPQNIPQPVFSSRNVTTSLVVWDGQTVVMGGLIREDLVKIEDKVPFLGDIPGLGFFFRNKGEFSQKKNLIIFVTARIVGPDGKPIHKAESLGVTESPAVPTPGATPTGTR